MSEQAKNTFANFMQIQPIIPRGVWQILRLFSVATIGLVIWGLYRFPEITLIAFWGITVPLLPFIFWMLPGLWRNLCPLAATNQLPRLFKFSFAKEMPSSIKRYANVIGLLLLFIAVPLRKVVLNDDGDALAAALIGILV